MPLHVRYNIGGVEVAVWKITEMAHELSSLVACDVAGEVPVSLCEARRKEMLAVRALLALVCGSDARILYDADCKPRLAGCEGYISVSHTRGYALLVYSRTEQVGADIELLQRNIENVAVKVVDTVLLDGLQPEERQRALLVRWCVCEALFKIVGNLGGTFKDNVVLETPLPLADGSVDVMIKGIPQWDKKKYKASCICGNDFLAVLCREVVAR